MGSSLTWTISPSSDRDPEPEAWGETDRKGWSSSLKLVVRTGEGV
jgi:hypothetical protein